MSGSSRTWNAPRPNPALMLTLGVANRWFLLRGLPILRSVPVVRDLPFMRGYFRVRSIDIPPPDLARLKNAVNAGTVAFLGPNHPEFAADWMVDKEISTLVSPRMASWADKGIVAVAPGFWGMNNLIANDGGDDARNYSVEWALKGEGVLLHPEGTVRWTNDYVHPLFPGIAQMAIAAAARTDKPVYIVPLVWRYHFVRDVRPRIIRDINGLERKLHVPISDGNVARRFQALQENTLARRMKHFGYELTVDGDFFDRQTAFQCWLITDLARRHSVDATDDTDKYIARLAKAARNELATHRDDASFDRAPLKHDIAMAEEAKRLGEFTRAVYGGAMLTQEHISESLKRLRDRLFKRNWKDTLNNMLPRPFGPRDVHVGVPEPISVHRVNAEEEPAYVAELLSETRKRMQVRLDEITASIAADVARYSVVNPFV